MHATKYIVRITYQDGKSEDLSYPEQMKEHAYAAFNTFKKFAFVKEITLAESTVRILEHSPKL